jgi:hypothetical protein
VVNYTLSIVGRKYRSFKKIRRADLKRLAAIARCDRAEFFKKHPDWRKLYANRLLCTALCQGAAAHYLNGKRGINDFDVYSFYAVHPLRHWYAKRRATVDFNNERFGRSKDRQQYVGRRVDCLGRSISAKLGEDPVTALLRYLAERPTATARLLAENPIVLLGPSLGRIVWRGSTPHSKATNKKRPAP